MAEYYEPKKANETSNKKNNTPYRKIMLRQFIVAVICFLIVKFICIGNFSFSNSFKENIMLSATKNTDLTVVENIRNKISNFFLIINEKNKGGADINEKKIFETN